MRILLSKGLIKVTLAILAISLFSSFFAGCTKDKSQNTASINKTTAGATVKSTAASVSKTAAAATGTVKASASQAAASAAQGGTATNDSAGTGDGNSVTEDNEGEAVLPGGVKEEAPFNLGGRQVRITSWQILDLSGDTPGATAATKSVHHNIKEAELKYNFNMIRDTSYCMAAALYNEKMMSQIMAGINPADIFTLNSATAGTFNFIKNGLVVCLSDYIDFENDLYMKNHTLKPDNIFSGKIYGVNQFHNTTNGGILYNTDILAKEGLEDIWELYDQHRWNWATALDYSIQATKDTNGDGMIDQWGGTMYNDSTFITSMLNSNGLPTVGQVNGEMVCNFETPEGIKALQFASELIFVHKVIGSGGGTAYRKGTVLFLWGPYWYNQTCINDRLESSLAGPLPDGPDKPMDFVIHAPGTNYYVSSLCDIPKEAATILRDIVITWTEDGKNHYPIYKAALETGIQPYEEGSSSRYFWTKRDCERVLYNYYNIASDFAAVTGTSGMFGNIVKDIMKGVAVTTAVNTYIGTVNDRLDEFNVDLANLK